jgi:hypothetical protein
MTEGHNTKCQECGTIYRQLYEAFRSDYGEMRERVRDAWMQSGLELSKFHKKYLSSTMDALETSDPNNEMQGQFPRSAEVRRKASDHELKTGHSVMMNGWRTSGIGWDLASWFR